MEPPYGFLAAAAALAMTTVTSRCQDPPLPPTPAFPPLTQTRDPASRVPPPPFRPGPPASRIRMDNTHRRWFNRNLGLWRSRRQYFFPDDEVLRVDMVLRVEGQEPEADGEARYRFTWWPEADHGFFERKPQYRREGTIEARLCGHQLFRNAGFHGGEPHRSQIRQVDEHELVFESRYLGWDVLEHIRLLDQDRHRARSIYSWREGVLDLVEIHHEIRLEGAGLPLP